MKRTILTLFGIVLSQLAFADSTIEQAQEALKAQGYYYGEVTGEKNADTTAAIRRFQIRNGLEVTGELNDETLRALNASSSSARTEAARPAPPAIDLRENPPQERLPLVPAVPPPAPDVMPAQPPLSLFTNTPYEMAPPELQRQIVLGAETMLRRRGLYRGALDGVVGPELEFALRAYQTRIGLPPSGRLDMETLASLGLLPGQQPGDRARRRYFPRPADEPPVRGEWIR